MSKKQVTFAVSNKSDEEGYWTNSVSFILKGFEPCGLGKAVSPNSQSSKILWRFLLPSQGASVRSTLSNRLSFIWEEFREPAPSPAPLSTMLVSSTKREAILVCYCFPRKCLVQFPITFNMFTDTRLPILFIIYSFLPFKTLFIYSTLTQWLSSCFHPLPALAAILSLF